MRTAYENANNLIEEIQIIRHFCEIKKQSYYKTRKFESVDFALLQNEKVSGWAEVKRRYNSSNKYSTLAISADKIAAGKIKSIATNRPYFLIIGWDDCLGYIEIKPEDEFEIKIGGRRDRGDDADTEPMIHIPINFFTII